MTIAGFVLGVIGTLDYLIGALIILAINFCGGIVGAIGVFRWGTVSEQIKWMKEENQKYATEIDEMKQNTNELRNTVAGINEHVVELNQGADSLKEQIEQFDELKESLTQINADNEEIFEMINGINGMFDDMQQMAMEAAKASLLEAYYSAELRDGSEGLSQREWKSLVNRLPKEQQKQVRMLGSFQDLAGGDGVIDLKEFQGIINKVVNNLEDSYLKQIHKK
eukprot:CAMPEP_0114671374 /NCGR_PEP_ID=MMETSP0191-20121206/41063_1 /TAXON_ID=126664 /ORGANISM="Sorites sp." /LENGTH=222 /DNA_ID=CAMNT_0001931091 /DNA_START=225 /DNA_END=893 /DNA_ORIENTATION=-